MITATEGMTDEEIEARLHAILSIFEDSSGMGPYYDSHFVADTPTERRDQLQRVIQAMKHGDPHESA